MISRLTPLSSFDLDALAAWFAAGAVVRADSRQVQSGDIFLAFQGEYADGRDYIAAAVQAGARAVLWDPAGGFVFPNIDVPNCPVPELRARAGCVAAYALGFPAQNQVVVGVTGTNGKTSIAHWLAEAFHLIQGRSGLIGTVGCGVFGALSPSTHTTPDPVTVQTLLAALRDQQVKTVLMEVSSHGLDQFRVNGVPFTTAVFTNLTRDHLDYHGSMDSYGESKRRLFHWDGLKHAVINTDDSFGSELAAELGRLGYGPQVFSYGFNAEADVRVLALEMNLSGFQVDVATPWGEARIVSPLVGRFNVSNLLASLTVLCANGVPLAQAAQVLGQIHPAQGRMDRLGGGALPLVVIDYAHTPDALDKALSTLSEIRPEGSRLFCVFGCGGNRDQGKRPQMGAIASRLADVAVLTSDNPRLENPLNIIADVREGMSAQAHVEPDRRVAIAWAIAQAQAGDIVLIAGKGHEDYQDVAGVKQPFSDFAEAQAALAHKELA